MTLATHTLVPAAAPARQPRSLSGTAPRRPHRAATTDGPAPAPRPTGFVLYVEIDPDEFAALAGDVERAALTLRELAHEWLPTARTRAVLATGERTAPARPVLTAVPPLRETLAALPDTPTVAVDLTRRTVTAGGQEVRLTRTEFALLAHLVAADGRVVGRDELRATVWGAREVSATSRTVDAHVRRLRSVAALAPLIATVRGEGYRVAPRADLVVTP